MGILDGGYKKKFWELVKAIDNRYKVYELLVTQGSEPHPPGLQTLLQEFKNLKIRAWDIETSSNDTARLIKDLKQEALQQTIEEQGDLP